MIFPREEAEVGGRVEDLLDIVNFCAIARVPKLRTV
jgi:hypothetical protein